MPSFKNREKVICISNKGNEDALTVGKIYKLTYVGSYLHIKNDNGSEKCYDRNLFTKIQKEESNKMSIKIEIPVKYIVALVVALVIRIVFIACVANYSANLSEEACLLADIDIGGSYSPSLAFISARRQCRPRPIASVFSLGDWTPESLARDKESYLLCVEARKGLDESVKTTLRNRFAKK